MLTIPVGLQDIVNPRVSRRQVLAGMATTPAIFHASVAQASLVPWFDIRFDLSDDERVLTVVEVEHSAAEDLLATTAAETRSLEPAIPECLEGGKAKATSRPTAKTTTTDRCCWRLPAEAFGPKAWFDRQRPTCAVTKDAAAPRKIFVRDTILGALPASVVEFEFSRESKGDAAGRWHITLATTVWLANSTNGAEAKLERSLLTPLAKFLASDHSTFLSLKLQSETVDRTIRAMFDDRLRVASKGPKKFVGRLDKNLIWSVEAEGGGGIAAFDEQVILETFRFGWRRSAEERNAFFMGDAKPRLSEGVPLTLILGDTDEHHIVVRPASASERRQISLAARIGASSVDPAKQQTVVSLDIDDAEIAIFAKDARPIGPIGAGSLRLSQTHVPTKQPAVRTVLWGSAMVATPVRAADGETDKEVPEGLPVAEMTSPIGCLRIGPPAVEALEKRSPEPTPPPAEATKVAPDPGCDCKAVAEAASRTVDVFPGAKKSPVERMFQVACGDQGGARESTVFVVHDSPDSGGGPKGLRRILVDVSLHEASVALPDVSFSRLTFESGDMRLVYEDGKPFPELPAGEYPRLRPSSFIWAGPASGHPRAELDLSRATLTCARDYDLMKLRFRFFDLLLTFTPIPGIHPARSDCRVMQLEDGVVEDGRAILVAEFDPQHVLEQAIFRPEPPPFPDVELLELEGFEGKVEHPGNKETKKRENKEARKGKLRAAIVAHLAMLAPENRREFRRLVAGAMKQVESAYVAKGPGGSQPTENKPKLWPGARSCESKAVSGTVLKPFATFCDAYEARAKAALLPEDQQIYIGPVALDPDAMAIAREVQKTAMSDAVTAALEAMLYRVEMDVLPKIAAAAQRYPIDKRSGEPPLVDAEYFANALQMEKLLEQQEPLYGLFRDHFRDQAARSPQCAIGKANGDEVPEHAIEFLTPGNRPARYDQCAADRRKVDALASFVVLAMGKDPICDLVEARLSGPSRLAFRINCSPLAGLDAEEVGLPPTAGDGRTHPGRSSVAFKPIPFTFEALTDWSRHEPAVTRRAQKVFTALPSGLLPPLGNRAANCDDHAVLAFQGFPRRKVTAAERIAHTRASMSPPTEWETAIEIPSRLILSTAQDAVWRTGRPLPKTVVDSQACEASESDEYLPPPLKNGKHVVQPCDQTILSRHDLWSARLAVGDVAPNLRIVQSPDFRPMAIGAGLERPPATPPVDGEPAAASAYSPEADTKPSLADATAQPQDKPFLPKPLPQLPGHSAPPRGPYAPWLIGPEQLESTTLTPSSFAKDRRETDETLCKPRTPDKRFPLIRWLCERLDARKAIPVDDFKFFRTGLDANDRHQLVMLSSAYGLPVIGRRQATGEDVEVAGALVPGSGQIEPGADFEILDVSDDQAIYRPIPLNVRELSLTALGGSFWHDTAFKPAAGADDYWGRKVFDGFAIERWQQDIVLGRDIRGEVVYKGYLFPLGHRASLIKLTERVFLLTPKQGIKAMLRQRLFLRVGTPLKRYPAVGQPHRGRLWCAESVTLLTTRTPDIIDPTFPLGGAPDLPDAGKALLNGRIGLGPRPGLAFWPRTDITEQGLLKFQFRLNNGFTALPLIFVDNIAATNTESLKTIVDYYAGLPEEPWRTMVLNGQDVRYAPEQQSGDTVFATEKVVVGAHGRLNAYGDRWAGDLTKYGTTGVLEGAEQPPFYPRMDYGTVRLAQVERFSGGARVLTDVQYDGHYVRHGFDAKADTSPAASGDRVPTVSAQPNPLQVYLNLRSVVKLDMGNSGDRSAGIGRPNSKIIALSRLKGPLGGDDNVAYQTIAEDNPGKKPDTSQIETVHIDDAGAALINDDKKRRDLVSLAAHFDAASTQADDARPAEGASNLVTVVGSSPSAGDDSASPADELAKLHQTLKILQGAFSGDAKILGTIRIKDLLKLLGLPTPAEAMPELQETIEYGTAALREVNNATADLVSDVRTRVLAPLQAVVRRLRAQWLELDKSLVERQHQVSRRIGEAGVSLDFIYPEISQGLLGLEASLSAALAEQDALALPPKLAAVFEAGRRFVRVLAQVAANPVERLKDAVAGELQNQLAAFGPDLDSLRGFLGKIEQLVSIFRDPQLATTILKWVVENTTPEIRSAQLPIDLAPPSLLALANQLSPDLDADAKEHLKTADSALAEAFKFDPIELLRAAFQTFITDPSGNVEAAARGAVRAVFKAKENEINSALKTARDAISAIPNAQSKALETILKKEIKYYKNRYLKQILDDLEYKTWNKLPAEIFVAIEALDRALTCLVYARKLRNAVERKQPKEALAALSSLSVGVFGYDVPDDIKDVDNALKTFDGNILKDSSVEVSPDARGALTAEIIVCADYHDDGSAHPRLTPHDPPSSQLTKFAAGLVLAVQTSVEKLAKVREELPDEAGVSNEFREDYRNLLSFHVRVEGLVATLSPLIQSLYCQAVDLVAAYWAARSALADGVRLDDRDAISKLSRWTRRLTDTAAKLGDSVGKIAKPTGEFVTASENQAFLVGGVIAGAAGYIVETKKFAGLESDFKSLSDDLQKAEQKLSRNLAELALVAVKLLKSGSLVAGPTLTRLEDLLTRAQASLSSAGVSLDPELPNLVRAVNDLRAHLGKIGKYDIDANKFQGLKDFSDATITDEEGKQRKIADVFAGAAATYPDAGEKLRDLEARVLAAWRAFELKLTGLPNALKFLIEDRVIDSGIIEALADGYGKLLAARTDALKTIEGVPLLRATAPEALLVPPAFGATCDVKDTEKLPSERAECDRLHEENAILVEAVKKAKTNRKVTADLRAVLGGWASGTAAPIVIVDQAKDIVVELFRGNVLSVIDVAAFRDEIEDAIAELIPTRSTLRYDFQSSVTKESDPNAIFQPKLGGPFGIQVRAAVDLLNPKSVDFRARGEIGPFDVKLVGSLIDALTLKFGGAAFEIVGGSKPRFDVIYDDFVIGKSLEFAQQLQDYLLPKEGGFFLQPLTRTAGLEAGYGICIPDIGLGGVSFSNITLNVSAELPFSDQDSFFKVSLGRRLSPFMISIAPFAGAGYFSIYAAPDGVRGFEASFEFGGGGAIGFGPLRAQARIMVGVFVRVLEVEKGVRTTEISGTFFAGGSASIWIFSFATSLYVRLGSSDNGSMYGEAIFSFSFSLGIVDYDYSITAFKEEKKLGTSKATSLDNDLIRFAAFDDPATMSDAEPIVVAALKKEAAASKDRSEGGGSVLSRAACPSKDWQTYISYFDLDLLRGCEVT